MSVQNKERNVVAKRANFLIANNRIVVSKFPSCLFLKCRFTKQTRISKKDPPDIKSYPVALVTVLGGSNKNRINMTYTDWLITFLENQKLSHINAISNRDKLTYINVSTKCLPGIYIWPTKYIVRRTNSSKMVVLVLFSNTARIETLQNFAAVACSNIFVLEDVDKENLQENIERFLPMVKKQPAELLPCASSFSPLHASSKMKTAAITFHEYLRNNELTPIKRTDGANVQLRDLRLFLQNVEDKLNKATDVSGHLSSKSKSFSMPDLTDSETDTNSTDFVDLEVDNISNMIANLTVNEDDKINPFLNTEQIVINIPADLSCEQLQCGPVLAKLEQSLQHWICTNLSSENISDLSLHCRKYLSENKHNIFEELDELVDIIDLHNVQLCNLFDNYVCFAGDIDYNQLQVLAKAVHIRSSSRLATKNHIHSIFTGNILQMTANQLHLLYVNVNVKIMFVEEETAKKVMNVLVKEYNNSIVKLLSEQSNHKSIHKLHALIKDFLVCKAENCLNIGDRFNGIAKFYSQRIDDCCESSFKKIKKQHIENKWSFLVFETYIEEYLNTFYANKELNIFGPSSEHLNERHLNAVAKSTSDIQGNFRSSLLLRLYMHLVYITEAANHEHPLENLVSSKPYCLHLSRDYYSIHLKTVTDIRFIDYGGKSSSNSYVALTTKNEIIFDMKAKEYCPKNCKACGSILDFIIDPNLGNKYNRYLVEQFIQKISNEVERAFEGKHSNAIIIIPHDLTVECRLRLRKFARSAGIDQVFLVSEISLLAYSRICLKKPSSHENADVIVAIQIYDHGIRADIFEKMSHNRVHLSAVSFENWKDCTANNNAVFTCWKKPKITNPFSSQYPYSDCQATLRNALRHAFSQLNESVEKKDTKYCITSDNSNYHYIFNDVFREHLSWLEISNFREDDSIRAALHFSDNPSSIVANILDHGVHIASFESLHDTILKNYQEFGHETQDLISHTNAELEEKKTNLLQTCFDMKSQLENGTVEVRRLTKKLIVECIDRAEKIAGDEYTTEELVFSEQQELNDLIIEHQFSKV